MEQLQVKILGATETPTDQGIKIQMSPKTKKSKLHIEHAKVQRLV